ncbi:hypothetical protein G7Y79_00035g070600 [Physcia stellaris]|nr:hypothetical protein G7Y79_00035g070600 [Physcia stellaris]
MALVSYSSSDDSDSERKAAPKQLKPSSGPEKPAFQKVVDRSNPHKVEVHLPESLKSSRDRLEDRQEPPSKRVRLGAGSAQDFNSLLPAPKRAVTPRGLPSSSATGKGGLARGSNLKTGANASFSRDPRVAAVDTATSSEETPAKDFPISIGHEEEDEAQAVDSGSSKNRKESPKKVSAAIFKPLSVGRKPKKKKIELQEDIAVGKASSSTQIKDIASVKKDSLFFAGGGAAAQSGQPAPKGEYRPMLYEPIRQSGDMTAASHVGNEHLEIQNDANEREKMMGNEALDNPKGSQGTSQSLDTIAADLNLTESARRQLFGRKKNKISEVSVVNFDTDQEYAANELLRQAGEQAQHNPVRSIAPGKHSLKQLVNAASHQKDALEEHFASGKRNKKEAGSKYGW